YHLAGVVLAQVVEVGRAVGPRPHVVGGLARPCDVGFVVPGLQPLGEWHRTIGGSTLTERGVLAAPAHGAAEGCEQDRRQGRRYLGVVLDETVDELVWKISHEGGLHVVAASGRRHSLRESLNGVVGQDS